MSLFWNYSNYRNGSLRVFIIIHVNSSPSDHPGSDHRCVIRTKWSISRSHLLRGIQVFYVRVIILKSIYEVTTRLCHMLVPKSAGFWCLSPKSKTIQWCHLGGIVWHIFGVKQTLQSHETWEPSICVLSWQQRVWKPRMHCMLQFDCFCHILTTRIYT